MQICTYYIFSVPQQKEVAGVWYRDHEGKQFLKIALPADAWSMAATIKTRKGVHRMTMDRWGDSTHKMSAYNNRYHPSNRDQRQIDRMERETMVLYPTLQPNPILPKKSPGFSGGRGMFRGLNWRAEGLRIQPSRNELETGREEGPSTSSFYRQQREAAPFVTRRRFHRKSPSRRPHRRTPYYPPSPQYRGDSTSEDEAEQVPEAKGKYTDPTPTPNPRDELDSMEEQEGSGKEESPGYATPPEGLPKTTQQLHTALSNQLDRALQEALDKPGPSCLRKQGGGDREPTPGPQALKQGELNLATENWSLIPNKVRFMDEPDTFRANVGRHRETQPRLVRAKTYPHLVFADPPASPDRETSRSPREQRAASNPPGETPKVTPDSTTSQELPSLEMHEAPPVPLEPEVEVIHHPEAPSPRKDDSDCEIVEPPMPFKPKKGWAKKRMEQTKKTLVLCIPRVNGPPVKREEAGASQMENPAPQVEGEDPGAGEEQNPQPDSGNGSMDEQD